MIRDGAAEQGIASALLCRVEQRHCRVLQGKGMARMGEASAWHGAVQYCTTKDMRSVVQFSNGLVLCSFVKQRQCSVVLSIAKARQGEAKHRKGRAWRRDEWYRKGRAKQKRLR